MKRKFEADNDAAVVAAAANMTLDDEVTFQSLGLDARLLQGIAKLGFANPTLVQAKAIPLALEGKDILGTCWWFGSNGNTILMKVQLEQKLVPERLPRTCCLCYRAYSRRRRYVQQLYTVDFSF